MPFKPVCNCRHHNFCECKPAGKAGLTTACRAREAGWRAQGIIHFTYEDYEKLRSKQNSCCAICRIELTSRLEAVDHDHRTGKVRGLLCRPCNANLHKARKAFWYLHPRWGWLREYAALGIINTLVVYLVYSPYVLLWVGLDSEQYIRWLQGGIIYSLLTGWLFALVIIRVKKRLFPS